MNENLYEVFRRRFPTDGAAPFIETPDGRRLAYRDMDLATGRLARRLLDRGVRPGDRVAAQVEKSPEALLLYLASLRVGAIYLPINPGYRRAEVAYFLKDAEPRVLACDPSLVPMVEDAAEGADVGHILTLDEHGRGSMIDGMDDLAPAPTVSVGGDAVAAILYTSGTTGRPKGAMLTHRNLASNILTLHQAWGFRPGDVLLHALPIFHTHGLFVAAGCVLANASPMLFLPRFDAGTVVDLLPRATVFMGVPTFYVRLLAHPGLTRERCRTMRLFVSGSAPLQVETFRAFQERTGHTILERYGMSETTMNASNPLDGERVAGSVGPPLPGVEIRIVDADGRVLPAGETGMIEVRGPNVFKGYWRQPEKTKAEFRPDGFFITGDVGVVDSRGYVSIVGRAKDLIITGGLNVYPKEIETAIDAIEGVDESAVVGLPHPDFGEAVVAVVKPKGGGSPSVEGIVQRLKGELAGYKIPKRIYFVDDLPRNAMGKVQKNLLRDQYRDAFAKDR